MRKQLVIIAIIAAVVIGIVAIVVAVRHPTVKQIAPSAGEIWYCPMHPTYTASKAGSCPICGMDLVRKEPIFYRNPMNPAVTSKTPMKDSMGMDYLPVYEEAATNETGAVSISAERQQLIGVKIGTVERRDLTETFQAAGRGANDQELYTAQTEYLRVLQLKDALRAQSVAGQSADLMGAARKRLTLMGMGEAEIKELEKQGRADETLFLPHGDPRAWIYVSVYEQDLARVKTGVTLEARTNVYPGEVFTGKVVSVSPVIDPNTRTATARVLIETRGRPARPEMFYDVTFRIPYVRVTAVPESAVMKTGERNLVFVAKGNGRFVPRDVVVGRRAGGYCEIIRGLAAGEQVVTSANFLIDSESRLKSATEGMK